MSRQEAPRTEIAPMVRIILFIGIISLMSILSSSKSFFLIIFVIGFGVCCTTVLTEGGSTSLNQSYIVMASSATVAAGGMSYKICPSSSDVCRIRFDFTVRFDYITQ